MSKPTITALACGILAVALFALGSYNATVVTGKLQSYAATGDPAAAVTSWDWVSTLASLLGGSGLSAVSLTAMAVAFLRQQGPVLIDHVLPGASDGAKAKSVDVAQIVAIQAALLIVKDPATKGSLLSAGRSAFDDLRDRTFPEPAEEGEVTP